MTHPTRIQLQRRKGWRMPPNTVKVDRSTKWGNPFTVDGAREAGWRGTDDQLREYCARQYRRWLAGDETLWQGHRADAVRAMILAHLPEVRGKNLACWCPLDQPCHADVLLELANLPEADE